MKYKIEVIDAKNNILFAFLFVYFSEIMTIKIINGLELSS